MFIDPCLYIYYITYINSAMQEQLSNIQLKFTTQIIPVIALFVCISFNKFLNVGYLEETKCPDAYETFLNSCSYLDECVKMKQEGRRFRTQVLGLTLLDILYEYSAIYSLGMNLLYKQVMHTHSFLSYCSSRTIKKSGS